MYTLQVGNQLSLADTQLATTLSSAFAHLIGKQQQQQLPNLMRWYRTCTSQPSIAALMGEQCTNSCYRLCLPYLWMLHAKFICTISNGVSENTDGMPVIKCLKRVKCLKLHVVTSM